MDKKKFIARKSIGEYISILAAVLAVISLIYYYSYTSSMGTTNTMVIILLLVSTICNIVYFAVDIESTFDIGIVEIVASVCNTVVLATFFLNSWSNLADLLNGIQIFSGGRGNLTSIIAIMVLLLVLELVEIIVCFMKKNKNISADGNPIKA